MTQPDLKAIGSRRDEWVTVVNRRDRDAYAALFTPDAVWLPPGQPAVRGRDAIRDWLRPFFERFRYDFSLQATAARVAGEWAIERGTFTSRLTPESGGAASTHRGTYIVLWRREPDGRWYIERYVDTSDMWPPSAAD